MKVTSHLFVSLLVIMAFSMSSLRLRKLYENVAVEFTQEVADHISIIPSSDSPVNCTLARISISVYKKKSFQDFASQYLSLMDLNPALLNSHNFQNAPPIS